MHFGAFQKRSKALHAQISQYAEVTGAADMSLGKLPFGSSTVECIFLNADSQWGLINNEPTGLLAMKVTLAENPDYKLRHVTLNLEFAVPDNSLSAPASVRITNHVKTEVLCGQVTESHATRETQVSPDIGLGPYGSIRGLGVKDTKDMLKQHRWIFTCHLLSGAKRTITCAQLMFEGNPDVEQVDCVGPVYTGLALVHDKTAFNVCLDIEGQVRKGNSPFAIRGKRYKSQSFDTRISPRHREQDIQANVKDFEDWLKKTNAAWLQAIGKVTVNAASQRDGIEPGRSRPSQCA